jgi:hypothetical protein
MPIAGKSINGIAPALRGGAIASVAIACAFSLYARSARAGGLEYTGQGAQSLARGGAVTARAEDPMVLAHNPAGLAELRGSQFLLNVNLALFDACVDPAGYYGWGAYLGGGQSELRDPETGELEALRLSEIEDGMAAQADYYSDPYDTVCFDQNVVPLPQIAWTRRLSEAVGIGFGLIFPSVQPSGAWGGKNGVIRGDDGKLRPAATRYMLLSSSNLGIFPTLGIGIRPVRQFRFGVSAEWGVIAVNNFTMAAATGGTSPHNDIVAHVKGQDWFVPALTASLHFVPVDAIDLVLAGRWQDDINAEGDLDTTTGVFDPALDSFTTGEIIITSIEQKMPWKVRAGIRYADRFAPRAGGTGREEADPAHWERIHDPLQDERWDIELDVEYQMNSRNDEQVITYRTGQGIFAQAAGGGPINSTIYPADPNDPTTRIEKHWKDQISARLGGSLNLVPGLFAISAGTHYETRGVTPDYMQIDFWPVQRLGLHTGIMLRVAESIDLVFSYAHVFQETIVVAPPEHRTRDVIDMERQATGGQSRNIDKRVGVLLDRAGNGLTELTEESQGTPQGTAKLNQVLSRTASGQPPFIINAGRYRSNFDIIAAGVNVHF